jgi:hypothetical protein
VPDSADPETVGAYLRALDRAEKAMDADLKRFLPLWDLAVPQEFKNRTWDYSKFGRGERFVHKPIPRSEFDEVMDQVKRWGLDQHLKERSFDNLVTNAA